MSIFSIHICVQLNKLIQQRLQDHAEVKKANFYATWAWTADSGQSMATQNCLALNQESYIQKHVFCISDCRERSDQNKHVRGRMKISLKKWLQLKKMTYYKMKRRSLGKVRKKTMKIRGQKYGEQINEQGEKWIRKTLGCTEEYTKFVVRYVQIKP